MTSLLVFAAILIWYQMGLVGSVIAMAATPYLSWSDKEDRIFAFTVAIFGPINLVAGILFALFTADRE